MRADANGGAMTPHTHIGGVNRPNELVPRAHISNVLLHSGLLLCNIIPQSIINCVSSGSQLLIDHPLLDLVFMVRYYRVDYSSFVHLGVDAASISTDL